MAAKRPTVQERATPVDASEDGPTEDELAGTIDGRVETLVDGVVVGWAWSSAHPAVRVPVVVRVDGEAVATGIADEEAAGLAKIGIGDGRHGFTIALPPELADGTTHQFAVTSAGDWIPFVPEWHATGGGAWEQTRFTAEPEPLPGAPRAVRPPIIDLPLAQTPVARVAVLGRNGWLFGLDDEEIEELRDETPRARPDAALAEVLDRTAHALHELGVRYVLAVAPTKLAVHPELAPVGLPEPDEQRHAVALARLARDHDQLDVLDLLPALRDATGHGALFHPRDEGLNARGAFFAQRALIKHAALAARGLVPLPVGRAAFAPTTAKEPNALEALPIVALADRALVPTELPPLADHAAEDVDASELRSVRMPAGAHLEIQGLPAPRVYERDDVPETPRVLMLGDPLIHALTPWVAETTSRLVVLSTTTPPLEQIELEMPDVVLHVLDERRLAGGPSAGHLIEGIAE